MEQQTEATPPAAEGTPASGEAAQQAAPEALAEGEDKAPENETPEQQEERRAGKFQRRLDRQKAARVAAETEARLLREENARLKAASEQAASRHQQDGEPKRDQYEDDASYHRALGRWEGQQESRQREARAEQDRQQAQRQTTQQQAQERIADSWGKREAEFVKSTADYEKKVGEFVEHDLQHFKQAAREAIVESEIGPALLYHLASNPEEAERIADLSPSRQAVEIGKLEAQLSRPARKTSSAPAPITPGNSGASGVKDPSRMNAQEYSAWRASQGSHWIKQPLHG